MQAIDRTFFASAKATVPESCTNARTAMASSPSDATPTHGWSNSDSTTSEAGDATPGSLIGRSQNHLSIFICVSGRVAGSWPIPQVWSNAISTQ